MLSSIMWLVSPVLHLHGIPTAFRPRFFLMDLRMLYVLDSGRYVVLCCSMPLFCWLDFVHMVEMLCWWFSGYCLSPSVYHWCRVLCGSVWENKQSHWKFFWGKPVQFVSWFHLRCWGGLCIGIKRKPNFWTALYSKVATKGIGIANFSRGGGYQLYPAWKIFHTFMQQRRLHNHAHPTRPMLEQETASAIL
jgi:hypothetical protein